MVEIKLPVYGIVLEVRSGGGTISHDHVYEVCHFCNQKDCVYDCDQSTAVASAMLSAPQRYKAIANEDDVKGRIANNGGVDAVMSFILALACAGIDVETPAFLEAIETTLDALGNN